MQHFYKMQLIFQVWKLAKSYTFKNQSPQTYSFPGQKNKKPISHKLGK